LCEFNAAEYIDFYVPIQDNCPSIEQGFMDGAFSDQQSAVSQLIEFMTLAER